MRVVNPRYNRLKQVAQSWLDDTVEYDEPQLLESLIELLTKVEITTLGYAREIRRNGRPGRNAVSRNKREHPKGARGSWTRED